MKWLRVHKKAIVALAGAVGTWAVTYFPDNHTVILVVGLVVAVGTGLGVHITTNEEEL